MTFVEGEQMLSAWMAENAYVSWVVRDRPWELEDELIAVLDLPLNLQGNQHNLFHPVLTGVRAECVAQAKALPVVPNPDIGGGRRPLHRRPDSNRDSNAPTLQGDVTLGGTRDRGALAQ